jgi:hypothetical protein
MFNFFYFFRTSTREEEDELPCGLVCRMLNFLGVGTNEYQVKKEKKKTRKQGSIKSGNSLKSFCQ